MPRYSVPVTILATITVNASDERAARAEAERFAEACDPSGYFVEGWNDVQRASGGPTIHDVSGFDVENIDLAEVETVDEEDSEC